MRFLALIELVFAALVAYIGYLQLQAALSLTTEGGGAAPSFLMAGGSLLAALLLAAVAIHALMTKRAHRGTHALPFIILALTASASLFVGRAG